MFQSFQFGSRKEGVSRNQVARQRFRRILVEQLEVRTVLAAEFEHISPAVVEALTAFQAQRPAVTVLPHSVPATLADLGSFSQPNARFQRDGDVLAQVRVPLGDTKTVGRLQALGVEIATDAAIFGLIDAWLSGPQLAAIDALPDIFQVALPETPTVDAGAFMTQGDSILNADDVRTRFSTFGVNGSGVKIGVISDGVTNLASAVASGDLPGGGSSVIVNPSAPGSGDEGTAMLEIIHDMAPGAQLYFSSVGVSAATFITSVQWLVGQGVNVIVDDISFFAEPYFEDGPVATAVATAIASGVTFVTSAGNRGQSHYQSMSQIDFMTGQHDFDSGLNTDRTLDVSVPHNSTLNVFLQWSNPSGSSGDNFDLFLLNSTETVTHASSTWVQNGNDMPLESLAWLNNTGVTQTYKIRVVASPAIPSREIELFLTGGVITESYLANVNGDALQAHKAVNSVITVAAINSGDPGNDTIAPYSSIGPSTIYTDFTSQTKTVRNSLDVAGIDAVSTKASLSGWAPFIPAGVFSGTSAAAPHIAAIVGLMRDAANNASGVDYVGMLNGSAVDLGAGGYDQTFGSGRADAEAAVFRAFMPSPTDMATASDNGKFNNDNVTSVTGITFTGSAPQDSYVSLWWNGLQVAAIQLTGGATSYSQVIWMGAGEYPFSVRVKPSSASPAAANSQHSSILTSYIDSLAATVPSTAPDLTAASDTGTSSTDNITTDTTPTFTGTAPTGSKVTLMVDGVASVSQTLTGGATTYTLTTPILAIGGHTVTVRHQMVATAPVSSYFDSPALAVSIDNGLPPVATISQVTPDPRGTYVEAIGITFDRPVSGFGVSDLLLTRNGGPNLLPGTAILTSSDSRVFNLSHLGDITLAAGSFNLTLNYAGSGIQSLASGLAPTAANPVELWTQTNAAFQNPNKYYDVNNDTFVNSIDMNTLINAINAHGSGPLPGSHSPLNPNFLDTNGDGNVSTLDLLTIINYLNLGYRDTPAMPDLATASDNGQFNNDNVTSNATQTITGTAPMNYFVALYRNGLQFQVQTQQLTGGSTTYSFTHTAQTNNVEVLMVRFKELSSSPDSDYSNASPGLFVYTDTLTTHVPSTAPDLVAASDTGLSSNDNITTDTTPTFSGTAPAGSVVELYANGAWVGSTQLGAGVTNYSVTSNPLPPGTYSYKTIARYVVSAPSTSYYSSPSLTVLIDNGQAPAATIAPVTPDPRNTVVDSVVISFDRPVSGFGLNDLSLTRSGGANRLPATATLSSSDSRVFTLSHLTDITMAAGSYNLTLNYAGSGIQSLASGAAPTGINPVELWTQANAAYQNPLRYLDVNNDTFVNSTDTTILVNALNSPGGGPLPGAHSPLNPNYLDVNGDNNLTSLDLLLVINFINGGYPSGPFLS